MKHIIAILVTLIAFAGMAQAVQTSFNETWEGYTNGATPYGSWELQAGEWGSMSSPGYASNQCYSVASGISQVHQAIDCDTQTTVVLQGWLKDSAFTNHSMLGFGDTLDDSSASVRIGANGAANYQVQYYVSSLGGIQSLDTGMPIEAGWHFMRLDLQSSAGSWNATYRIWNTAKTVQKMGTFTWAWDNVAANYVTLGSPGTTGPVAWDYIQVGSLADVGAAPSLPGAVPEPSSLIALGLGLIAMAAFVKRRKA